MGFGMATRQTLRQPYLSFHHWIRLVFSYVIIANVISILTGGIVNNKLRLKAIASGTFLKKHPSRQSHLSSVFSSVHHWIGLDLVYVVHPDAL